MNINLPEAIKVFENGAYFHAPPRPNRQKGPPYQIKWKGNIVAIRSGKYIWPTLGAAKCALRQKINNSRLIENAYPDVQSKYVVHSSTYSYLPHTLKDEFYNAVLDELQKQGILEFVPIT